MGFLWVSLELILLSLARLWASFWAPWSPKGLSLASLWPPFGSLGTPWGHLGHLGLPREAWDDFGSKLDVHFRANGSQGRDLCTKSNLAEFSPGSPRNEISTQSGIRAAAPNPTLLAPGARMTVVKHTPSNYIIADRYCIIPTQY